GGSGIRVDVESHGREDLDGAPDPSRADGGSGIRVDVESHGREDLDGAPDPSRAVGWFTSLFPVCLPASGADPGAHLRATREDLGARAARCAAPGAAGLTPSDAPLAGLDQAALDRLAEAAGARGVEAVYPLAPMQEGMLLHGLRAPDSRVYFQQLHCVFRGAL